MKRRVFALAGAFLLVALTQTAAYSQINQRWLLGFDLTDAQRAQIEQLQEQHRAAAAEAAAEIIKVRAEVQSLQVQPDPDLNALLRAMNRLSELENAQEIEALQHRKAYEDVLTEEQRNRFRPFQRGDGVLYLNSRIGRGRALTGLGGAFTGLGRSYMNTRWDFGRGRNARGNRIYNRGFQGGRGRGIPPVANRDFYRGDWAPQPIPRMEDLRGNPGFLGRGMIGGRRGAGMVLPPQPPPSPAG